MSKRSSLNSKVSQFDAQASTHQQKQKDNPFSTHNVTNMERKHFSKEEYGRPVKGSRSEGRGFRATALVNKEILELCEIINDYGEPCIVGEDNIPCKVISFGELFSMYTTISNKLVGILLRARKHNIVNFEGECLFQRKDDHVPVILLKPITEIREECHQIIDSTLAAITHPQKNKSSDQLSSDDQQ